MAANLDQFPADGAQRLVIRAQKSMVIASSVAMGAISLIGAGAILVLGSPLVSLICLAIGGFSLYAMLSGYLWVDWERVGVRRLPWGASCRRDELAYLRIVFMGRGSRRCAFVRKDGKTAFTVAANMFGTTQLKALAQSLGVPYYDLFSGASLGIQPGP